MDSKHQIGMFLRIKLFGHLWKLQINNQGKGFLIRPGGGAGGGRMEEKNPKINKRPLFLVLHIWEYSYEVIWNISVRKTVEKSEEKLISGFSS